MGLSQLSGGREKTKIPTSSKAAKANVGILNVLDQQELDPELEPKTLEAASEPSEPSEPYEQYEHYIICEPPQRCEPPEPCALSTVYESSGPYETYGSGSSERNHYEPYELQKPQEPRKHCKHSKPQGPGKFQEHRAHYEPQKLRKSQGSQGAHEAYRGHKAELPPHNLLWTSLSSPSECSAYDFARRSSFSRKRIQELSKPKKQWGAPDRRLSWGNQDPIRPICRSALKSQMTKRLESLAQPKEVSIRYVPNRVQYYYNCGRGSAIWDIPSCVPLRRPSRRIQRLSQPNKFRKIEIWNRSLSEFLTRDSLQLSSPSPRILRLSIAKGISPDYIPPKDIETKIVATALRAIPTPRIVDLANPRIKIEGLCYPQEGPDMPIRRVTQAALLNTPSPRTVFLAKAKALHQDYLPDRDPYWPVSYAAAHFKISPRIEALSHPSERAPMHIVYYDPAVFKVKPAALKAQCSPRVQELAAPLIR
ncbi:testicular haploid expressed gene protein-like [Pipistrellus kuhlii]|uniref:Theg spermatid protein like n=1 Tax=Pipistrellus kuhlii TaxID=59472 RepID=A0A7J8B6P4_PIPKU|nr:testicular haploid expressed gene protein-like [Pipistrellus kuhlii]KAF6393990.1 theg spermatid protein like [Pipistrellus kuhlii]